MENSEFHTVRGYQLIEQEKKLLTSAMEDYLEMIFRNIKKEDICASIRWRRCECKAFIGN